MRSPPRTTWRTACTARSCKRASPATTIPDVVVIGGGQAGLAAGYHLGRAGIDHRILDRAPAPGGAWRRMWASLQAFSPAPVSSLPGRLMPGGNHHHPSRDEVVAYLAGYERHHDLPVERSVNVSAVRRDGDRMRVDTDRGDLTARAVVSATGTWERPFWPYHPGRVRFAGHQLHAHDYDRPEALAGRRVMVVGGGNSGAQIAADLAPVADVVWVTTRPPSFLPDDVDGSVLFAEATRRYQAMLQGDPPGPATATLSDIVSTPAVRRARAAGDLMARRPPDALTRTGARWPDGTITDLDAVVWCTGFRPVLDHLAPLGLRDHRGRIAVDGSRSVAEPRLWLLGYGNWTGYASATILGAGRAAGRAVTEIAALVG